MVRTDPKDSHHAPFFFRRKVTQFVIASSRDRRWENFLQQFITKKLHCLRTKQSFKIWLMSWTSKYPEKQSCSIFWLQGWRIVARDNRVDLFSVVTSPDKHSLPKFNPLFLNAVSFGGRNTPTPIQTKRKPIFKKILFKRPPLWNRDLSCRDSNPSNVFFNGRGQTPNDPLCFSQHFESFRRAKKTLAVCSARARAKKCTCALWEREREREREKMTDTLERCNCKKRERERAADRNRASQALYSFNLRK